MMMSALLTSLCLGAKAEEVTWCLITDQGLAIAMSEITCLVAADEETTFAVVTKDGTVVDGVVRASFDQRVPTAIEKVSEEPIRVLHDLSMEGVDPNTPVRIFEPDGKLVRQSKAAHIQLDDLPAGLYLININKTTFKISKQ